MVTRAPKKKIQNTRSSRLGIRATPDQERVLKRAAEARQTNARSKVYSTKSCPSSSRTSLIIISFMILFSSLRFG